LNELSIFKMRIAFHDVYENELASDYKPAILGRSGLPTQMAATESGSLSALTKN
jgi:hypothetical protein